MRIGASRLRRCGASGSRPGAGCQGRGGTEYRNRVLAHLARVTDALSDAETVEEFEDLDGEAAPGADRIPILGRSERPAGGCLRYLRRGSGKRRHRRPRIEALGRDAQRIAAAALAVQEVLQRGVLELERGR